MAKFQLYYVGNYQLKLPHAKGRNTVGQQLPTLLRPFAHPAVCCCMLLSVVESCCAKFETSETFEICPSLHAVAKIASANLDISGFLTRLLQFKLLSFIFRFERFVGN